MAWIESHQALANHPKTLKLARLLGISRVAAVGHLHFLWWWATDYAQDGSLARFDALDIAIAADWQGDPNGLLRALREAGFLDEDDALHDWHNYAGRLIERRRADAARKRQSRASDIQQPSGGHPGDGARNTTTHNRTEHHPTATPLPPMTVRPVNGRQSRLAEAVGEARFAKIAGNFTEVNPQLDVAWFRDTMARIEATHPDLSTDQVATAVKATIGKTQDAFGRENGIRHPPALVAKWLREAIAEEVRK